MFVKMDYYNLLYYFVINKSNFDLLKKMWSQQNNIEYNLPMFFKSGINKGFIVKIWLR